MPDDANARGKIEHAVAALNTALGPSFTDEEQALTLRLSYDRGMRLRALLLKQGLSEAASADAPQHGRGPEHLDGTPIWALDLANLRIEWPARRVSLGRGRYRYI